MPDTRTDTSISVDSVQFFGNTNENPTPIVNTLTGLTLFFSSQTGVTPIQAFELSKDNTVIGIEIGKDQKNAFASRLNFETYNLGHLITAGIIHKRPIFQLNANTSTRRPTGVTAATVLSASVCAM